MVPTRLAELKACSKPFPDIPRIFALSRPTGAKGGAAAGCRRKFRESFPPLCSDGEGKACGWRVTFAVLASRFARVFENLLRPFVESGGRSASKPRRGNNSRSFPLLCSNLPDTGVPADAGNFNLLAPRSATDAIIMNGATGKSWGHADADE